jgi:F-type H+-transporting ATPase subunit gamma
MTQRLAEMRVRINSVRQLGSAITALRGIAASHVQQSRGRLAGVRTYSDIIAEAISHALPLLPDAGDGGAAAGRLPGAVLVFCAELGFAGAFSDELLDVVAWGQPGARLLCVGNRGLVRARARGMAVDWSAPMISQVGGVAALAGRIVAALEQRIRERQFARVEMIFRRPGRGNELETERRQLLPVQLARFGRKAEGQAPLTNLKPTLLLERLAAEYLFAQVSEAILHSFAAENTARLASMAAARENIDRKLETLGLEERMARQGEITDEVIELSAGASALGRH